jgi:hypothetical protein
MNSFAVLSGALDPRALRLAAKKWQGAIPGYSDDVIADSSG